MELSSCDPTIITALLYPWQQRLPGLQGNSDNHAAEVYNQCGIVPGPLLQMAGFDYLVIRSKTTTFEIAQPSLALQQI